MRRYRTPISDNARWSSVALRANDIIISTPAKCGTTWTQMICALLIFRSTTFDRSLDLISPWVDNQMRPLDEVRRDLDAQQHRRFLKTHTPYDGLPHDADVTYICVGRDPRDVAVSWANHVDNTNMEVMFAARERSVGLDDLFDFFPDGPPEPASEDPVERFWAWVDEPFQEVKNVSCLEGTMEHLATFWAVRREPNIVLLHYSDLQADLGGEMRRLAGRLGIEVPDARLDEFVRAARFDSMRDRAAVLAPESTNSLWHDNAQFFRAGCDGQWKALLDDDGCRRYDARIAALGLPPDLVAWAHRGSEATV